MISTIGLKIKVLCISKGMNTKELSKCSGICTDTICDVIYGRRKSQKRTLNQIASALGTTSEELSSFNIEDKVMEIYHQVELGDKIRLFCLNKGISITELSKMTEIDCSTAWNAMNNGRDIIDKTVRKLLYALKNIQGNILSSKLDDELDTLCRRSKIGDRIKLICLEKEMSIAELQQKSGLPYETIWRLLNNRTVPNDRTIYKVAIALDTTVEKILTDELYDKAMEDYEVQAIMKKLNELFKEKGMSVKELSERAGVSKATIANMECSEVNMQMQTLEKIAKALGTTVVKVANSK